MKHAWVLSYVVNGWKVESFGCVETGKRIMLGNGVVGILAESVNKWERRAPLTPSHCARLLHGGTGVSRIIVQPSTKRIHHDALYEEVGAEISQDLSQCGLILGIKQPKVHISWFFKLLFSCWSLFSWYQTFNDVNEFVAAGNDIAR